MLKLYDMFNKKPKEEPKPAPKLDPQTVKKLQEQTIDKKDKIVKK